MIELNHSVTHAVKSRNIVAPKLPLFRAPRWAQNGHTQTILGAYLPYGKVPYRAVGHKLFLPDGDCIILHDDCPSSWAVGDRCVLMLHGAAGCHGSPYLVRVADKLNQRGVRTFRMDQRGCGAGAGLARYPGHAGRSDDVGATIQFIHQLCNESRISLIGFSLGGNLVLKYLAESGTQIPSCLDKAVTIGPAIDLVRCAHNLEQGWPLFYSRSFARRLCMAVSAWPTSAHWNGSRTPLTATSLLDFDSQFTAPISGFRDVWDYYERSSAAPLLPNVTLPTLILAAADDPLVPINTIADVPRPDCVGLYITEFGGHVGYFGISNGDPDRRWLDWRLLELITEWQP